MSVIRDCLNMQNKIEIRKISFDSHPYSWLTPYSYDVQVDVAINSVEHQIAFIAYYDSLVGDWMLDYKNEDFAENNATQDEDIAGEILGLVFSHLHIAENTSIFAFNIKDLIDSFTQKETQGLIQLSYNDIVDIFKKDFSTSEIFSRKEPVSKAEINDEMSVAFKEVFYLAFSRISKEDRKFYIDKCKKDSSLNTKTLMRKKNKQLLFNS